MKKSLILILLFILMLAACTPAGAAPEPTSAEATAVPPTAPSATTEPETALTGLMQVYENKDAGFSLRLPTDWTVSEAQSAPYGTLYLVGPEPLTPGDPANNSIIVADAGQTTAGQLAEQLLCGGGCQPPALTEVKLRNGITAQTALIGCSDFPKCRYTEQILNKTGVVCPNGGGEIIERKTRRGRTFYGCSRYPDCEWRSWQKPLLDIDHACDGIMVETKDGNKDCTACGLKESVADQTPAVAAD